MFYAQSTSAVIIRPIAAWEALPIPVSVCGIWVVFCSVLSGTETVRLIRDGEPRTATSTFTQLLSSVESCVQTMVYGCECQFGVSNVRTGVDACDCTRRQNGHRERDHRFPAPSSKPCQNWLRHWRGTLYFRAATRRRCQRLPEILGTNQTPSTGLRHPSFNWRKVPESGARSVGTNQTEEAA